MGEEGRRMITLPDELVERILIRVPFPLIFKARLLSKSWLTRFQPISSEDTDDDEQKRLRNSFQEKVVEWSSTHWKTLCPVFFREDDLIAYDRTSNHWQRMPWLSFLPNELFTRLAWWRLEGALLLVAERPRRVDGIETFPLYVTNILSRSWKQLPPPALDEKLPSWPNSWLIPMSSHTYKVVLCHDDMKTGSTAMSADVYDSTLGGWSKILYVPEDPRRCWKSNWAYFRGFLYRLISRYGDGMASKLVSFNVEEQVFDLLELPVSDIFMRSDDVGLVVCNGCLLVLEYLGKSVIVHKLDLGLRRLLDVTQGPPASHNFGSPLRQPASGGDCIFFMKKIALCVPSKEVGDREEFREAVLDRVLAYNMLQNEWSDIPMPSCVRQSYNPQSRCLSYFQQSLIQHARMITTNLRYRISENEYEWATSSFQPGLNPFVAV